MSKKKVEQVGKAALIGTVVIISPTILWLYLLGKILRADKNTKGICAFGPRASGKTTLLRLITKNQCLVPGGEGTVRDTIEEVEVYFGNRKIKLKETVDIGGGNSYVQEYREIIEDKDFVFIVFNLNDLMNSKKEINKAGVLDFQARLLAISKIIKGKNYQVVGSHLDCLNISDKEYKKRREEYFNLIGRKFFEMLPDFNVDSHFIMLDLGDESKMKEYLDTVFSKLIKNKWYEKFVLASKSK